jgi:hypothetical protein
VANKCDPSQLESLSNELNLKNLVDNKFSSARNSLLCIRACQLHAYCDSLFQGMEWLIRAIEMNHHQLSNRIMIDKKAQKDPSQYSRNISRRQSNTIYPEEIMPK